MVGQGSTGAGKSSTLALQHPLAYAFQLSNTCRGVPVPVVELRRWKPVPSPRPGRSMSSGHHSVQIAGPSSNSGRVSGQVLDVAEGMKKEIGTVSTDVSER